LINSIYRQGVMVNQYPTSGMNRRAVQVLREIDEHTARLRKGVASMSERIARDAAAHRQSAARLNQYVKAVSARVNALEKQAPRSARGLAVSPTLITRVGQLLLSRG
jgi:hypothetical protein